jgi:fumarate reductase subunit C
MGAEMMLNRPDPARLHRPRLPATWWLRKRAYLLFWLREMSSAFIAAFLVVLMAELYQLGEGAEHHQAFLARLASPGWILFHLVVLAFAVYHSLTWFYTTSIVIPLRVGGKALPRALFTALNVVAWLAVSVALFVLYQAL